MIIDRYMAREVGRPFMVVSAVLVVIFWTYSLSRFLMDADAGLLVANEVFRLSALRAVISLDVLLPLSFYFAVMMGMGRLYSDSEIYAMRSSGISEKRLMQPVIRFAFVLALLIALLSLAVRPWAYARSFAIRAEAAAGSEVDRVKPERFYRFEDSGRTVFIENISADGRSIHGAFIHQREGADLRVITSLNGSLENLARPGYHRLTLFDAQIYQRVTDAPDVFAELGEFSVWLPAAEAEPVGYKTKASPSRSLLVSSDLVDRAELQWRMSTPLSTLLLALLAIPLSRGRPRQGPYARMLIALVIYAVYFNVLDVNRTWVEHGTAHNIWWVPGALLAVVVLLYLPWRKWRGRMLSRGSVVTP